MARSAWLAGGLVGSGLVTLLGSGALPLPAVPLAWVQGGDTRAAPRAPAFPRPRPFSSPARATTPSNVSMALHMHGSLSEGEAGMGWHAAQAGAASVDVLWWTDHDVFYFPDGSPDVAGYDFESGGRTDWVESWPSEDTLNVSWMTLEEDDPPEEASFEARTYASRRGSYGGEVQATASAAGSDERQTWYIDVNPRFHFKSLMAELTLSFWVRPWTTSADGEIQVNVPLNAANSGSDYAVDDDYRSIVFYHGGPGHPAISDDGNTLYVEIEADEGAWTEVTADLTRMARDAWGDETAYDLHGEMITVRTVVSSGAGIEYHLDDLAWEISVRGDDLVDLQRDWIDTYHPFGPLQLVGIEVSPLPEGHFGALGEGIPMLPYSTGDTWDASSLSDWVHGYGGLVVYNHMFGVSTQRDDAATRSANIAEQTEELIAAEAWGVDCIEIGYRIRNGILQDFLDVWDAVGMAGVYVTGVGAFDLHDEVDYTEFQNNFLTYASVGTLDEAALLTELAAGRVWFMDPSELTGGTAGLSISSADVAGLQMGSVVVGRSAATALTFTATEVPASSEVRRVENGVVVATTTVTSRRRYTETVDVEPAGGLVVRWEVVSVDDQPIAYSNPVYFVDEDDGEIPANRYVAG